MSVVDAPSAFPFGVSWPGARLRARPAGEGVLRELRATTGTARAPLSGAMCGSVCRWETQPDTAPRTPAPPHSGDRQGAPHTTTVTAIDTQRTQAYDF